MKRSDKHGRGRGPADRQAEAEHSYTLPVDGQTVHEILDVLKEEQQRNKELTKAVLDMAKKLKTRVEVVAPKGPQLVEPLREDKPAEGYKPELDNVYFDASDDKDVECNFDELSDAESVSETGINADELKRLRDLVKKGE